MKRISFLTIMVLFFWNINSVAQTNDEDKIDITLFGNMSSPIGKFGENYGVNAEITRRFGFQIGEEVGLAKTGFGLGVEFTKNVLMENLNWIVSAKLLLNSTDVFEITDEFKEDLGDTVNLSFENGSWYNIPLMTGFKYNYNISSDLSFYTMLQAGINLTQQASRKASINNMVVEETKFRFTPDFGFEVGFGVELINKFNLGVRYLNLNSPRYDGTRKLNEKYFATIPKREMNVDGDERPVTMLLFVVGYKL